MKKLISSLLLACCAAAASSAPRFEGISTEHGEALLATITSRISQYIAGKLAVEEIDSISLAPLGPGFYLVSARQGRLVALTDERVTNVILLGGYVAITDGKKVDVLAAVREKVGYVPPKPAVAAASTGTRVELHAAGAIPLFNGNRVVHVICDPNLPECRRFNNDVLKRARDVRAYIYPISVAAPGNWREYSVRDLLCWPQQLQFAQWDAVINGDSPSAAGSAGQPCARTQQIDDLTERIKSSPNPKALPILMLQDGRTFSGKGMTPSEFERLLSQ
ncbi:MAG: hypothetical protein HYX47_11975 [Burkholderiales bacterium]|nr:hypothetical protein [Burkholderiales bacterium]